MASTTPNTVVLKVNGAPEADREVFEETVVTNPIMPGEWALWSSTGVTPGPTAGDVDAPDLFCVENAYLDPRVVTTPAIDTDYAVAAKARLIMPQTGDLLYSFLEAGANVAKWDPLEHNGSGHLQAYTSGKIVAYAEEAKDNSGGGSPVRIKVRKA